MPSDRPDKPELYGLRVRVEYPFTTESTSDTKAAILDMDAEEAAHNCARLRVEDKLEDWYCGEYVEESALRERVLRPEKMSFQKWGQLLVGWDKWHALVEAGRGVVRNAGGTDLVGRKGVDGRGDGLWTESMDRWLPSGDAPDKHGRDTSTLHVYSDGGVQGEALGRAGLYGWVVVQFGGREKTGEFRGRPRILKQAAGGGRFVSWERRVSSTRAQTIALAAAVTAVEPLLRQGKRITVHADNSGMVDTFTRN